MSWDNYAPLSTETVVHFDDELDMIMGDGIAVPDDTSPTTDYTGTKHYHIANINEADSTVTLWNYTDDQFEQVDFETLYEWRKNDAPFTPILLNVELTAAPPHQSLWKRITSFMNDATPEHVGVKIHGSLMQSPLSIEKTSRNEFGFTIQVAIRADVHGNEITEPWTADVSVTEPDYTVFIESVKETVADALVRQTAIDADAATELVTIALKSYEANLHKRVGLDETVMFKDFDELESAFDAGVEQHKDSDFAVTFHERANNSLVHHL